MNKKNPYWYRPRPSVVARRFLCRENPGLKELRRWLFWAWWAKPRTLLERTASIWNLFLLPAIRLKRCLQTLKAHGEEVQSTYGVNKSHQLFDLLRLAVGTDIDAITYYRYHLFQGDRRVNQREYLDQSGKLLQVLIQRLPKHDDDVIFSDKLAFEKWCASKGLSAVKSYAVISNISKENSSLSGADLPSNDLIAKPTQGRAGQGVTLWRYRSRSDRSFWENLIDGKQLDAKDLIRHLHHSAVKSKTPYLLQPRLLNHPVLLSMGNGSLSTVRIMTVQEKKEAPVFILAAALRIPVGDIDVDNFDQGGLASGIDLETGKCGLAIQKRGQYPLPFFDRNPKTKAIIKDQVLPYWKETIQLSITAHQHLVTRIPIIGWDIAILPDGPVLIEANHLPGEQLVQMASGIPLGSTRYPNVLCNALCEAFNIR